jgi:hypothetical protein
MKFIFSFILVTHGLIHVLGFLSAYTLIGYDKQISGISKPIGVFWLLTSILFLVAAVLLLTHKNWFYLALLGVLISQILIVLVWKDAKFGTFANIIILLVSLSALGQQRFQKMVNDESSELLKQVSHNTSKIISENDLNQLPPIISTWVKNSGVINHPEIVAVRLKQKGEMRTKPSGKWMPFSATQYFNVKNPSFVWNTNVEAMSVINMVGRNKLSDGSGEMLIKLAALIPVVNESDNEQINSGAMIRYLAEICWFPSAALNDYISWTPIDETSAEGTFTYKDHSVSGVFSFNTSGDLISFEADRYYGGNKDATLETWRVETLSFKEFDGIKIPNKNKVIWKLSDGDFTWLNLEITDIEFNPSKIYNLNTK